MSESKANQPIQLNETPVSKIKKREKGKERKKGREREGGYAVEIQISGRAFLLLSYHTYGPRCDPQ